MDASHAYGVLTLSRATIIIETARRAQSAAVGLDPQVVNLDFGELLTIRQADQARAQALFDVAGDEKLHSLLARTRVDFRPGASQSKQPHPSYSLLVYARELDQMIPVYRGAVWRELPERDATPREAHASPETTRLTTSRKEPFREQAIAFIEERGTAYPGSTRVMVDLIKYMYDRSGLEFSPLFDRLKGVRLRRTLANGWQQPFMAVYPGQPSIQFTHRGGLFDAAQLATVAGNSSVYRLVVPEHSNVRPYLAEAKKLMVAAYAAAYEAAPRPASPKSGRRPSVTRRRPFRIKPFNPRLDPIKTKPQDPFTRDPVEVDRGNEGHRATVEALWRFLQRNGTSAISISPGPDPDLLWTNGKTLFVAEAKSLTAANQDKQLRLGLGQVLDYQEQYRSMNRWDSVQGVLLAERKPADSRWERLCVAHDVVLAWPGRFPRLLL
jgi:hypothetical protein